MNGFLTVFKLFRRREWVLVVATFFLTVCQVYFDLKIPEYMSSVTTILIEDGSPSAVMEEAVGMILCALGSLLFALMITITIGMVSSAFSQHLREMQFDRVQSFSMEEMGRFSTYSLITRSTNDIKQIQDFIGICMESIMRAPIISIWALYKISASHFAWTTVTSVAVILMVVCVMTILRKIVPGFKRIQKLTDGINKVSSELVDGIRFIRAYNADAYEAEKFAKANGNLTDNNLHVYRTMAYNTPINGFIRNGLTMSIYWTGAFIIAGTADYASRMEFFSNMIVFATYAGLILNGFRSLTQLFNLVPRASVSSQRINEILDTAPSIVGGDVTDSGDVRGEVSFRDVSFRFPGNGSDTLSGISFEAGRGETVSVIGSTGCGKTALVNLVPRFYDVCGGQLLVDGIDVREYGLDALRQKVGFVSQSNSIMSGTVRDNVNYGMDPGTRTDEDVWRALRIAQADGFVRDLGGLDYNIVEKGKNLSGGQKQRLAIARAVNKRPEIYVFDDSFSALDFRTDRELRRALREETGSATVIIVAQRIGTVIDSDRIVVMDKGRIVGVGRHGELLESCGIYREIVESQLEGGA